jgi:hypothetical protein
LLKESQSQTLSLDSTLGRQREIRPGQLELPGWTSEPKELEARQSRSAWRRTPRNWRKPKRVSENPR